MIAVTFALPNESSGFLRLLGERQREIAVLHTGVGEKVCRPRLAPFLDSHDFELLVSSGFAGGADPSLRVGDLVLAENVSAPQLLDVAGGLLVARLGKLVSAGGVIETLTEREQFAREHGAVAVDMETECIACACAAKSLPMLSLRVISDTAAAPFPAPPSVLFNLEKQKSEPLRLAAHLAGHPASIVRLMRFARQIARARAELTGALVTLLPELA